MSSDSCQRRGSTGRWPPDHNAAGDPRHPDRPKSPKRVTCRRAARRRVRSEGRSTPVTTQRAERSNRCEATPMIAGSRQPYRGNDGYRAPVIGLASVSSPGTLANFANHRTTGHLRPHKHGIRGRKDDRWPFGQGQGVRTMPRWDFDHFYTLHAASPAAPRMEGWRTLAALAQATRRLRMGTLRLSAEP
jgi:hypothetical protein